MAARDGILAGGNFIVDHVKIIDAYPAPETLATILSRTESNGGGPYNVLKNLTRLGASFPRQALGLVGCDPAGDWIAADCAQSEIDTTRLTRSETADTSYTDAMTVAGTGQRTFFHHRGSNSLLEPAHFQFDGQARLFYLGYLLLLDALDRLRSDGSTGAAEVLARATSQGYRTCVDIVSTPHPDFSAIVTASLPHVDLLFINEFEAASVLSPGNRQTPASLDDLIPWGEALLEAGVREAVCLHMADGAVLVPRNGGPTIQPALAVPESEIAGSTGAGDAFAAGVLLRWHAAADWEECLHLGVCAAAACLGHETPSEGVLPVDQCLALGDRYGFRSG